MEKREYLLKTNKNKEVIVPSGTKFIIQTIKGRMLALQGNSAFLSSIAEAQREESEEKKKEVILKMTQEQRREQMKYMDNMICLAVVEPKLSIEENQETLSIQDLSDEDYYFLLNEVNSFSIGGVGDKPNRFPEDKVASGL